MRLDCPTYCPDCQSPISVHPLSFYAPRVCLDCGWGYPEARQEGRRDLLGALGLVAGSAGMVILGIVGLLFGSIQAEILGLIGIVGLILSVDRVLLAWGFMRLLGDRQPGDEAPEWCPPELAFDAPRSVARRDGFERPWQALLRMSIGVVFLGIMAVAAPVAPWERGALIGFLALGAILMAVRPVRITLEDWRHQRLASHGRLALGNLMKIEQTWFGGSRLRYRYLDEEGRAYEGRIWHPAPPSDLSEGAAVPILYRRGAPSISVPYPAARYQIEGLRTSARPERAG